MKIIRHICLLLPVSGLILFSCNKDEKTMINPDIPEDWPSDSIRVLRSDLQFPWEILWGKDNYIWMTQRPGKISKLDPKTGDILFSSQLSEVVSNGEGGLLGMVQDPNFLDNGFIYVVYNYNSSNGYREKVVRFTYQNDALVSPFTLIDDIGAATNHNGSRLWIEGNEPKIFITTGDATISGQAQDTSKLNGKTLRLNLDGTIPADNPFSGNPVWSFGHRNPQGLVFVNGIMYTSEHGPSIEDEVNIIEKGRNYGWPNVNGPCNGSEASFCSTNNVKEPIWSSGSVTFATSGLDYYNHDRIPAWKNSLLLATLKDATLYQLKLSTDGKSILETHELFRNQWGRIRDICVSPAGRVYLCTSNGSGKDKLVEISRLE